MQVTIIHVAIQCSQAAALCTQAEQYLQAMYTEDLAIQWARAQSGRVPE